jgi:hypothetical protein
MSEPTVPSFKVPDSVAEEESVKPANDAIRDRLLEQSGRKKAEETGGTADTGRTSGGESESDTPQKATTRRSASGNE